MTRHLRFLALGTLTTLLLLSACTSTTAPVVVGPERPVLAFVGEEEGGNARFSLTNETQVPWTYHGYDTSPIYSVEIRTEEGWEPRMLGWCGTGLAEQVLAPGATLSFLVALEPDTESRVIVSLGAEDGTQAAILSPVVGGR